MGSSTWDVLNLGLFNSLGKPGGNITGNISLFDPEIDAKRLELLKEMLPSANRVACLSRIEEWESPWGQSVEVAAQKLGLTMVLAAHTPDNYEAALALITASSVDALLSILAHPNTEIGRCSSISPAKIGYQTVTPSEKPLRSVA
jgi:putative tryptophan/tyrosine transport system substrate-binding protein